MYLLVESQKPLKLSQKNGEENLILIENRDKLFSKFLEKIKRAKDIRLLLATILKKQRIQITCHSHLDHFLLLLLAFLLGRPYFYFGFYFKIVRLAIDEAESRNKDNAIDFSKYSLQKVLINFRRYMTIAEGSQVIFFFWIAFL